jgi:hypothetical protein
MGIDDVISEIASLRATKFDPSLVMHAEDFVPTRDELESDEAVARYVGATR